MWYSEFCYAVDRVPWCRLLHVYTVVLSFVVLNVVILSVIMLNVDILSAIVPIVVMLCVIMPAVTFFNHYAEVEWRYSEWWVSLFWMPVSLCQIYGLSLGPFRFMLIIHFILISGKFCRNGLNVLKLFCIVIYEFLK